MNDKRDIIPDNGIYNEVSHYKVVKKLMDGKVVLKHYESGAELIITEEYINKYMHSADIIRRSVPVSRTGMEEIFSIIPVGDVFTVEFIKESKKPSNEEYLTKAQKIKDELISIIKSNKVKDPEYIIDLAWSHTVDKKSQPEKRTLRGYKNYDSSVIGLYSVMDMDINENKALNIKNVQSLIYRGTYYFLK